MTSLHDPDTHSPANLSRESSRVTSNSRPSRRYQALLLVSGFLMTFHVNGINQIFGIFQEYYTSPKSNVQGTQQQDALVALVGTIGSGLTWSGSIFVNPLIARTENVKIITLAGTLMMSLGLLLASLCSQLWQLYLTQAFMYGIGSSMYYFPIMSLTPVYFDRHRGFAIGIIAAGSGIGGVVLAPVLQTLLDKYGVQWALRILGIWNLVVGIPVSCVVRHRPGFGFRTATRMNMGLVKRGTFVYQAFGAFLQAAGNTVPLYYMTSYSISVLSYSSKAGSTLLAINSAINSVSRVAMGVMADKMGRQNTMICGVLMSSFSVFALWYNAPRDRFIAFVVLYGIYAGSYNALLPTTITEVYGVESYTNVNGFIYFIRGLGSILGAPLAGVILGTYRSADSSLFLNSTLLQKRYNYVVIYDGILLLCAGMCVLCVRWLDSRDKDGWKWKA
ncbi:MFS general substrate transporter [Mycena floridula]|nr:MFS general substrate transporter [Mycena floridula]